MKTNNEVYKISNTTGIAFPKDTSTPIELKFYEYSFDLKDIEPKVALYDVKFSSIDVLWDYTDVTWVKRESTALPFAVNSSTSSVKLPQILSI